MSATPAITNTDPYIRYVKTLQEVPQEIIAGNNPTDCMICHDTYGSSEREGEALRIAITKCHHIFCKTCVDKAIEEDSERRCPLCRTTLGEVAPIASDEDVANFIHAVMIDFILGIQLRRVLNNMITLPSGIVRVEPTPATRSDEVATFSIGPMRLRHRPRRDARPYARPDHSVSRAQTSESSSRESFLILRFVSNSFSLPSNSPNENTSDDNLSDNNVDETDEPFNPNRRES
jgi:hypothetical protein